MKRLGYYWKERAPVLLLLGLCAMIFALVLDLYHLPAEAVGYGAALCGVVAGVWGVADWIRWNKKVSLLESMQGQAALLLGHLPESRGLPEHLYQELLREMLEEHRAGVSAADARIRMANDYYTMWVHQIKTPIAAMRLMLQEDNTERGRELSAELFRIERYVELVLSYLRLGSQSTDYLIRMTPLDPILRQAARKYAPLFIRGKVSLDLAETDLRVLTDEKWLQLVVEQILSNAVKYAPGGRVTVRCEGENLIIQDNGAGIAQEDLPRIFERGFTGCNGRMDKRATGIGLSLCQQICQRLGHTLTVDSELGKGTKVTVGLARPYLEVE